jgi:hypothetical protein
LTREQFLKNAYLPLLAALKAGNTEEADKLNVAVVPKLFTRILMMWQIG